MSAQQSLSVFADSSWDIVDQWDFEDGFGVHCPDCYGKMESGYWPIAEEELNGLHGTGCSDCQTVVPFPAPPEHYGRRGIGPHRVSVTTRSGETVEVGVAIIEGEDQEVFGSDD